MAPVALFPKNIVEQTKAAGVNYSLFPPGKFIPPSISPARHIFRQHVLRPLINPNQRNSNLIFIQAQAGQGKSILAAQFLHYIKAKFAWIQVDIQDRDLNIFLTALMLALVNDFPALVNSRSFKIIINEELNQNVTSHLASGLLKDLAGIVQNDYYLVLDDLHLLKPSHNCIRFLLNFARQLPPQFHLILLSRSPLEEIGNSCIFLDNEDLALRHGEVADILTHVFNLSFSAERVKELHHTIEGWVMGLIMARHVLKQVPDFDISEYLKGSSPKQYQLFFKNELLACLNCHQRQVLFSLSLLDNIPLELAKSLSHNIEIFLSRLVKDNFFMRCIEKPTPTYYFHQLFKDFLQIQAAQEVTVSKQRKIFTKAGQWYLSNNQKGQALCYYLKANAFGMADRLLQHEALKIVTTHRIGVLKEIVKTIHSKQVSSYPWLSFFIANIYFRSDPFKAEVYLEQARQYFIKIQDGPGELIATATLLAFHAAIDCQFKQGKRFLPRAEELYHLYWAKISLSARVQSAYAIALALCYFTGETRRAAKYINPIFRQAEEKGLDDAMAGASVARLLISCLEGNLSVSRQCIEDTLFLLSNPKVGRLVKLVMFCQHLSLLGLEGSFALYDHYRTLFENMEGNHLLSKTVSRPLLLIADINNAIAQEQIDQALTLLQTGLQSNYSGQSAHLQSLYLGYKAYIFAVLGQKDQALLTIKQAIKLRQQVGGAYHKTIIKMIQGSVYTLLNKPQVAGPFLTKAISLSKGLGETFFRVSAYAYRALLYLNSNRIKRALDDIRLFLSTMKDNQYLFFHLWNRQVMEKLLTTAIKHNIEKEYAQKLAHERMLLAIPSKSEAPIPLLQVFTLGKLEMKINGKNIADFKDFSSTQKELIALLASSPKSGVSLETIQLTFWPDSPPEKVRSKFDNLLGRLRKTLNQLLTPFSANTYLSMEKGFLRFTNCRIDAIDFTSEINCGLKYMKENEIWQAGNAFWRAHFLYDGKFMPNVHLTEKTKLYRKQLQQAYLQSAHHRTHILSTNSRTLEAIEVCRKALTLEPTFQPLVKSLYNLLIQNNELEQAALSIETYKNALMSEGFSIEELDRIMEDFWMA